MDLTVLNNLVVEAEQLLTDSNDLVAMLNNKGEEIRQKATQISNFLEAAKVNIDNAKAMLAPQ